MSLLEGTYQKFLEDYNNPPAYAAAKILNALTDMSARHDSDKINFLKSLADGSLGFAIAMKEFNALYRGYRISSQGLAIEAAEQLSILVRARAKLADLIHQDFSSAGRTFRFMSLNQSALSGCSGACLALTRIVAAALEHGSYESSNKQTDEKLFSPPLSSWQTTWPMLYPAPNALSRSYNPSA